MLTGRFDSLVSDASLTRTTDGQESHLPVAHNNVSLWLSSVPETRLCLKTAPGVLPAGGVLHPACFLLNLGSHTPLCS